MSWNIGRNMRFSWERTIKGSPCHRLFIEDMTENALLISIADENGFLVLSCEDGENAGAVCCWDDSCTLESSGDECNTD